MLDDHLRSKSKIDNEDKYNTALILSKSKYWQKQL